MMPFSPSFLRAVVETSNPLSERFTSAVAVGSKAPPVVSPASAVLQVGCDITCSDEAVLDVGKYQIVGENTVKGTEVWRVSKYRKDGKGTVKAVNNIAKDALAQAMSDGKVSLCVAAANAVAA